MKAVRILAASTALIALLAAPVEAAVNIAPAQLSGSVVKINSTMIHPQTTQGSSVVSTPSITETQGSSVVSLKGITHSQPVAVSVMIPISPNVPNATSLTTSEQRMVDEINQARAAAGVAPVQVDMRLVTAARIKANDLYVNNYFSHVSPVFGYTASLLPGLGLNVNYWSENVAGNRTVDAAEAALEGDIPHRVNILDPYVNYVGVGILEGISPYNLYVQEFAHEG